MIFVKLILFLETFIRMIFNAFSQYRNPQKLEIPKSHAWRMIQISSLTLIRVLARAACVSSFSKLLTA